VGIGGIGNGRRVFACRPDVVGEVSNFTDFFPTTYILSDIVIGTSVTATVSNQLEREI
jgi:multisubunit Na+/H+ antiporter MnhC subunit